MILESDNKLPLTKRERNTIQICFNELPIMVNDVIKYKYDYVRVKFPTTYSEIVSTIINDKYSNDQMQAIINNYLAGDHLEEYNEMQEWRKLAKDIGKQIISFAEK